MTMFAIVDLETTGGRPESDRITEIAILIHDGNSVVKTFSSLVNPECSIPYSITRITGISNEMVMNAPKFHEIAKKVLEHLRDCVFVAHNVRFDYGFVRAAFKNLGYTYTSPTLCTVRLSRKVFPGFSSYSLGNLSDRLAIPISNRHRALGDAEATAILFGRMIQLQPDLFKGESRVTEQKLTSFPPLLNPSVYHALPEGKVGVYYFYNENKDLIYIGKSTDIKKRIAQHFALTANGSRRSIDMKSAIADIQYTETGNELIALLLESDEIKKYKPIYNISQKKTRAVPFYGIFSHLDLFGYINLSIKKLEDGDQPLTTSDASIRAREFLYDQVEKFNLCLSKCDLHKTGGSCFNRQIHKCKGACCNEESSEAYNERAIKAIESFSFNMESFLIQGKGRTPTEMAIVCIENGQYLGYGYLDASVGKTGINDMRKCIQRFAHNRDIQNILCAELKKEYTKHYYNPSQLSS